MAGLALGQSADEAFFEGFLWLAGVVLIAVLAAVILTYVHARVKRSSQGAQLLFSLAQLRRLRDQGELTTAEYEALRRRLLDADKDASNADR